MNTYADKKQANKCKSIADMIYQEQAGSKSTAHIVDNRPEAIEQRKLQRKADSHHANLDLSQKAAQLKVINKIKEPNTAKINAELSKVKSNSFGKPIFDYLDKDDIGEINIIDAEINNASEKEVRINANGENLDSTIMHEMTHVVHANIDNTQFNLEGIYRGLVKLYAEIASKKDLLTSNSFGTYFLLQEEELVTQEWESKYGIEENNKNKRNIPVRKHYMDEARFQNGENSGDLNEDDQNTYRKIYSVDSPKSLQRLNSYKDFWDLLDAWEIWLNEHVKEQYFPSDWKDWKVNKMKDEKGELKKRIEEKKANLKKMLDILPKIEMPIAD